MTDDEKRCLARQRIIQDYDGAPPWQEPGRLKAMEEAYVRRIEEEKKNAEL